MGYVFRGTNHNDPVYLDEPLADKCGTRAGYRVHIRAKEDPCDPCAAAHSVYQLEYLRSYVPSCGTVTGHRAHVKAGEACVECASAAASHVPVRRAQRRRRKTWTPTKCGTTAGYSAHYFYDVPVCRPCRAAQTVYQNSRKAA